MPPCQGGGREFEPRLPLHLFVKIFSGYARRSGGIGRRDGLKNHWEATLMSVRPRPSAPQRLNAELCSGSTAGFEPVCPGSNPGSAANSFKSKISLCLDVRK